MHHTPQFGNAYLTHGNHIVKAVREGSDEANIYKILLSHRDATNHTIPCEIIESESTEPFLILPWIESSSAVAVKAARNWPLSKILDYVYQVLEVRSNIWV